MLNCKTYLPFHYLKPSWFHVMCAKTYFTFLFPPVWHIGLIWIRIEVVSTINWFFCPDLTFQGERTVNVLNKFKITLKCFINTEQTSWLFQCLMYNFTFHCKLYVMIRSVRVISFDVDATITRLMIIYCTSWSDPSESSVLYRTALTNNCIGLLHRTAQLVL